MYLNIRGANNTPDAHPPSDRQPSRESHADAEAAMRQYLQNSNEHDEKMQKKHQRESTRR